MVRARATLAGAKVACADTGASAAVTPARSRAPGASASDAAGVLVRRGTTCRCPHPVPYQDPGQWAACAKCGHWLSSVRAQALGAEPRDAERARAEDPGAVPPPGTGPDPRGRAERGGARPRDGADRASSAAAQKRRGSGPPSVEDRRALSLLMGGRA